MDGNISYSHETCMMHTSCMYVCIRMLLFNLIRALKKNPYTSQTHFTYFSANCVYIHHRIQNNGKKRAQAKRAQAGYCLFTHIHSDEHFVIQSLFHLTLSFFQPLNDFNFACFCHSFEQIYYGVANLIN